MNFSGFSPNQGLSPGFTNNIPVLNPQSGISPTNYGKFASGLSPTQGPTFNTILGPNGPSLYQPGIPIPSNTNMMPQVSTSMSFFFSLLFL